MFVLQFWNSLTRGTRMVPNRHGIATGLVLVLATWLAGPVASVLAKRPEAGEAGPVKPPMPAIESLQLEPSALVLTDGRDGRQVLVWGITRDGQKFDLSSEAVFKDDLPLVTVAEGRYLYPANPGEGVITITAA